MAKEQRRVLFSGMVQGVGFRYTACRVAAGYDVSGYVRNMENGDVECLVEGEVQEVGNFLAEIAGRMKGYIHHQTQQVAPFTGRYRGFSVEY